MNNETIVHFGISYTLTEEEKERLEEVIKSFVINNLKKEVSDFEYEIINNE